MNAPEKLEAPAATAWPIVLAFGLTLVFAGLVTAASVSILGAILAVAGAVGWFRQVLPVESLEWAPVVQEEIAIETSRGSVDRVAGIGAIPRAWLPPRVASSFWPGFCQGRIAYSGSATVTYKIALLTAGLATGWIVVASPVAHLDHHLLTAHMVQHLLLMLVAAPLILLGTRNSLRMRWRPHPAFCWLAGTVTVILWHVPTVFELPLQAPHWHTIEHASFFLAGLLFWYPVIHPGFATRPWTLPLYLFLATLPCDALAAFLAFCGHVVYRPYLSAYGGMFGLSPLEDQALAGALMWLTVTLAYLIPALVFANHIRVEIAFPCQDFVGRESHVTSVRVRRVERSPR